MTQKHFEALALAIAQLDVDRDTKVKVAKAIGDVCQSFQSKFNRPLFEHQCGLVAA